MDPNLRTHEFTSLKRPQGEKVFEVYAEQSTPAAYRVFWYYGYVLILQRKWHYKEPS